MTAPRVKVTQAELRRLSIQHDVAPVKNGVDDILAIGTGKDFTIFWAAPEFGEVRA